jgi:hypothetical protein
MLFWFSGLTATRTLLLNINLKADGLLNLSDDSAIYLQIGFTIIFIVYQFVRLIRMRTRPQDEGDFVDAIQETRTFQSKAWGKLTSKLKETEIREFSQFVYEENQIGRINTLNLLKVLWIIILGSITHELLQELIARF